MKKAFILVIFLVFMMSYSLAFTSYTCPVCPVCGLPLFWQCEIKLGIEIMDEIMDEMMELMYLTKFNPGAIYGLYHCWGCDRYWWMEWNVDSE